MDGFLVSTLKQELVKDSNSSMKRKRFCLKTVIWLPTKMWRNKFNWKIESKMVRRSILEIHFSKLVGE
jgi:hypothetical protein